MKRRRITLAVCSFVFMGAVAIGWYAMHTAGFGQVRQDADDICQLIVAGDIDRLNRHASLDGDLYFIQGLIAHRDRLKQGYRIEVGRNGFNGKTWGDAFEITHLAQIDLGDGHKIELCYRRENGRLSIVNSGWGYFGPSTGKFEQGIKVGIDESPNQRPQLPGDARGAESEVVDESARAAGN